MAESTERKGNPCIRALLAMLALLLIQEGVGKAGSAVADLFSYRLLDPDGAFGWQSVHHAVLLLLAVGVVALLGKPLKSNFGFQIGDSKTGIRYFVIFTAALTAISLGYHVFLKIGGSPVTYAFPLNARNVLGTLGFQLLLSGTAEETLYRALPITVLVFALGRGVKVKGSVTLEILLASLLFAAAHIRWSLSPFSLNASVPQLLYAFAIGTVQGMAYQESRSVLYPMLMHSVSNVLMVGAGYLFASAV